MTPFSLAMWSILIGVSPLLVALLASMIANMLGCELNEANAPKCMFLGINIGDILYGMFVFAWLGMLTIGLAFIGVIVSIFWAIFG